MRPLIGIVGRGGFITSGEFNSIQVPEKCRIAVIKSGGVPFIITPPQLVEYHESAPKDLARLTTEEKEIIARQLELCDGILMPGGSKRFEYDLYIIDYALKHDIPVLGICLGMQIMTMVDDYGNTTSNLTEVDNHNQCGVLLVHEVTINRESKLFSIIGKERFWVNSRHRMMVTNPGTFSVCGKSSDGIIELIERNDKRFAIGVQWHPEMMLDDNDQKKIFDHFVEKCRERLR